MSQPRSLMVLKRAFILYIFLINNLFLTDDIVPDQHLDSVDAALAYNDDHFQALKFLKKTLSAIRITLCAFA